MKPKSLSIALIVIACLSFNTLKAKAEIKYSITDTICCPPDSLKVISTNYPVFCVSWQVASDSTCRTPYGFTVQWRPYPWTGPWLEAIKVYTGGTTVIFCESVTVCTSYQWRVRTICDTANGGTYSDWVYENKFAMQNCGGSDFEGTDDKKDSPDRTGNKTINSSQILKQKEN